MKIEVPYFQTQIWIFIWANLEKSGEWGSFPLQKQANSYGYGYLLKLEPFTKRMNCFHLWRATCSTTPQNTSKWLESRSDRIRVSWGFPPGESVLKRIKKGLFTRSMNKEQMEAPYRIFCQMYSIHPSNFI